MLIISLEDNKHLFSFTSLFVNKIGENRERKYGILRD